MKNIWQFQKRFGIFLDFSPKNGIYFAKKAFIFQKRHLFSRNGIYFPKKAFIFQKCHLFFKNAISISRNAIYFSEMPFIDPKGHFCYHYYQHHPQNHQRPMLLIIPHTHLFYMSHPMSLMNVFYNKDPTEPMKAMIVYSCAKLKGWMGFEHILPSNWGQLIVTIKDID